VSTSRPLADHDVIVCSGSGGVGKTTVAAALGIEAARTGRRVVVVTIDPARRLADALGLADGLSGEPQQIHLDDITGELWATMLDSPAMFERVVRSNAKSPDQADRIVSNRFYRTIATAVSGTQEYMASEALYELHADPRFDLVIVDTPPSRHALEFLAAPGVLARFLDHPVFKLLMLPTRTGFKVLSLATQPLLYAVGRVVGSEVLADTSAFFQAFSGMEAGFRDRAAAVTELLHADTTTFVLVASPSADTVAEAMWFADQLAEHGFGVGAVVANRVHPEFGKEGAADARRRAEQAADTGSSDEAALWSNLATMRDRASREREVLAPLLARNEVDCTIEVPMLAADVHDLAALEHIATHLR
jgi:anion-transporting  ArsA/GET3 family ATPase